jgi:hypothetical protein
MQDSLELNVTQRRLLVIEPFVLLACIVLIPLQIVEWNIIIDPRLYVDYGLWTRMVMPSVYGGPQISVFPTSVPGLASRALAVLLAVTLILATIIVRKRSILPTSITRLQGIMFATVIIDAAIFLMILLKFGPGFSGLGLGLVADDRFVSIPISCMPVLALSMAFCLANESVFKKGLRVARGIAA